MSKKAIVKYKRVGWAMAWEGDVDTTLVRNTRQNLIHDLGRDLNPNGPQFLKEEMASGIAVPIKLYVEVKP